MSGHNVTIIASLQCPHGGAVQLTNAGGRVRAGGSAVITATDLLTVTGCPYQIPSSPPVPSPCVQTRWLVPDSRVRVNGVATVSQLSAGVSTASIPQGPPQVVSTQSRVKSQ